MLITNYNTLGLFLWWRINTISLSWINSQPTKTRNFWRLNSNLSCMLFLINLKLIGYRKILGSYAILKFFFWLQRIRGFYKGVAEHEYDISFSIWCVCTKIRQLLPRKCQPLLTWKNNIYMWKKQRKRNKYCRIKYLIWSQRLQKFSDVAIFSISSKRAIFTLK